MLYESTGTGSGQLVIGDSTYPVTDSYFGGVFNATVTNPGLAHYESVEYFGGNKTFERIKKCDGIKKIFAQNNNIKLVEINYNEVHNIKNIFINEGVI